MDMPPFHRRLLQIALEVTDSLGFVLAGGYAMRAHGMVDRPSQDLDFATVTAPSIPEAIATLAEQYGAEPLEVTITRGTPLLGQLIVVDPDLDMSCAIDLMKLPLQQPPVSIGELTVASLDDMAGMKMAALHGRNAPRDFIDVASLRDLHGFSTLERLGALFDDDFRLEGLLNRLESAAIADPSRYVDYGLTETEAHDLQLFALEWHEDLAMRLLEGVVELG